MKQRVISVVLQTLACLLVFAFVFVISLSINARATAEPFSLEKMFELDNVKEVAGAFGVIAAIMLVFWGVKKIR